jgi:hypothetical protein
MNRLSISIKSQTWEVFIKIQDLVIWYLQKAHILNIKLQNCENKWWKKEFHANIEHTELVNSGVHYKACWQR